MVTKKKSDDSKDFKQTNVRVMFLGLLILLAVLSFLVVKPFVTTILTSAIIAYVLFPIFNWLKKKTGFPGLAATLCILLALVVIVVPVSFMISEIVTESDSALRGLLGGVGEGKLFEECETKDSVSCMLYSSTLSFGDNIGVDASIYIQEGIKRTINRAVSMFANLLFQITNLVFYLFVMFFVLFFMLVDGKTVAKKVEQLLPLSKDHRETVMNTFAEMIHATLYGAILVSILQGFIAGVGFVIFGVSNPILWGLLSIIAAFLPFVGAALVWFPLMLQMLFEGLILSNNSLIFKSIGLLLYGVLIVGTIDNFLKPKIIGERARMHPVVVLLGVFGGIAMFGFVGLFIGPLLLALFIAMFKIYELQTLGRRVR